MKLLNAAASWPPWAAHSVQGDEEGVRGLLKNLLVLGFHTGSKEQAGGFCELPPGASPWEGGFGERGAGGTLSAPLLTRAASQPLLLHWGLA